MTIEELKTIVEETYDTVIKGPDGDYVHMGIPDLNASMKCSIWPSGRIIQVDIGSCWIRVQSWKLDRKTIIQTITDYLWMLMN